MVHIECGADFQAFIKLADSALVVVVCVNNFPHAHQPMEGRVILSSLLPSDLFALQVVVMECPLNVLFGITHSKI